MTRHGMMRTCIARFGFFEAYEDRAEYYVLDTRGELLRRVLHPAKDWDDARKLARRLSLAEAKQRTSAKT
jgi:hypothetical protein